MKLLEITAMVLTFISLSGLCYILSKTVFKDLEGQAQSLETAKSLKPIEYFISPRKLTVLQITDGIIMAVIALCLLIFINAHWIVTAVFTLLAGILAGVAPYVYYMQKVKMRKNDYDSKVLGLVLGVNNGLRAGIALPQAMEMVGRDIGGAMQEELNIALSEYRLGIDLPEALQHMNNRMPNENMQLLIASIALTQKSGGSLSDILGNLAITIRQRMSFQTKIQTLTAQGRFEAIVMASAPLVAFIFLYVLDPDLMSPMLKTPVGIAAILAVIVLVSFGFFLIKKIITIEV